MTIKNTPFQQEVLNFCKVLADEVNALVDPADAQYEISCEHEHSLCVLITNKNKFFKNGAKARLIWFWPFQGKWHTWINYPKFFELERSGEPFRSEDYMEETPSWAVYGAAEKGFDPAEIRFLRNKNKAPTQVWYGLWQNLLF